MPLFLVHGFTGYLLNNEKGFLYGILPDIISFSLFFYRHFKKYDLDMNIINKIHSKDMTNIDWFLYDISHSLVLWTILLLITKNKLFYIPIISIIFDIFLHSEKFKGWRGPKFLYPLSNIYVEGIHWYSFLGIIITLISIMIFIKYKNRIKRYLFEKE